MTDLREDTEFNEDGFIATITFYTEDENNPGQLVPDVKYFVYRYQGINAIDYDMYYPDSAGGWTFYGTVRGELDSKGEVSNSIRSNIGVTKSMSLPNSGSMTTTVGIRRLHTLLIIGITMSMPTRTSLMPMVS